MRKLLGILCILFCLTGCASFLERISSVMSPQEETNDHIKDYYESLLGDREVNPNVSYQDFLLALQQQAEKESLQLRKKGIDNINFNILTIWALENNIDKIREELRSYCPSENNQYCQKLEVLYDTMTKVRKDICMFTLNKNKGKARDSLFKNGDSCYLGYNLTQEEVKALFVNPDRNFVIKWGCIIDYNTTYMSVPGDKKETIFDTTYLLFAI